MVRGGSRARPVGGSASRDGARLLSVLRKIPYALRPEGLYTPAGAAVPCGYGQGARPTLAPRVSLCGPPAKTMGIPFYSRSLDSNN